MTASLKRVAVDDEVIGWLGEAVGAAHSWDSVRRALGARDAEGTDLRLRPFVFAFSYALQEYFSLSRERAGGPFGACMAGDG